MARNVALFITCLTDQFYPHVGLAVTRVLEHYGCTVHFPHEQTCCGQPFYNNGHHPQAADLARRMIAIFEPYDHVVTPSASCCAMLRENYPRLLGDDPAWKAGCLKLAASTYEFVEFLTNVLKVDFFRLSLPEPRTLTYHHACHLRSFRDEQQSMRLLDRMGNVNLRPMPNAEQCCGFGGAFALNFPAISQAIAQDKVDAIAASGADTVVCTEAGCTMNLSGLCHRRGLPARFVHVAELVADALGLDLARW